MREHRVPRRRRSAIPVGVRNPWMAIGQIGVVPADARSSSTRSVTRVAARSARRRRAASAAASRFFMLASLARRVLVYWAGRQAPSTLSLFFLGVVVVMGYALSADLLRAKQLVVELSETRAGGRARPPTRPTSAPSRATSPRDAIVASNEWRELFGFAPRRAADTEQRAAADPCRRPRGVRRAHGHAATQERANTRRIPRCRCPTADMRWIARHRPGRVRRARAGRCAAAARASTSPPRKQAEQEMLRLRQDIAHVGRVSVMGQLASALAHEINQPLGAILRNAEAAALFMQAPVARPGTRSARSSRTSARTTSAPAPSSTGCAPC